MQLACAIRDLEISLESLDCLPICSKAPGSQGAKEMTDADSAPCGDFSETHKVRDISDESADFPVPSGATRRR